MSAKRPADGQEGPPAAKSRKTAMTRPLGVVDSASNIKDGEMIVIDNDPCDCMLVKVTPSAKVDNFFVLQLIKCTDGQNNSQYVIYKRYGRTGTHGTAEREDFDEMEDASASFEQAFAELTGLTWENRFETPKRRKYTLIEQNFTEKQRGFKGASFQYYIDDGVDGKTTGWYDYDDSVDPYVEQLFHEYIANPQYTNRILAMGDFTYEIDLVKMTQTNVTHRNRTCRRIRRCPHKQVDTNMASQTGKNDNKSPEEIWEEYRTIALNKLPEEGEIRKLYRDNWWPGPDYAEDDFECIPRLVQLLKDYPDLPQRDIFAICETRVVNKDGSEVSNEPIVAIDDEEEICKRANEIAIAICNYRLYEDSRSAAYDDQVPTLKKTLKNAQMGLYKNLDEIFEIEAQLGETYLGVAYDVANAMGMELESDAGEVEVNPMVAWLIQTGLATIAVNSINAL